MDDNIKKDIREMGWGGVNILIELVQERVYLRFLDTVVIDPLVS
jgi:hypothetical protein